MTTNDEKTPGDYYLEGLHDGQRGTANYVDIWLKKQDPANPDLDSLKALLDEVLER